MIRHLALIFCFLTAVSSRAVTLLDDTFADGTRTNQSLPTDSAWFTTSAVNMRCYTNFLSITNLSGSSGWWTYFTAAGAPVSLNLGDTLTASLTMTPNGVGVQNSSKNMRFGIFNSAGTRPSGDGSLPTASYLGYAFFSNFGLTWGANNEMRYRSAFSNNDPLNSSGDSTIFGTGANTSGTIAFSNNASYTLTFSITKTGANAVSVTTTWFGGGLSNSVTATDASGLFTNFDIIEIRPSGFATTANNFNFSEVKVVLISVGAAPAISFSPSDVAAYTGQSAFFSVISDGTAPLAYQWYFNTNTVLNGARIPRSR